MEWRGRKDGELQGRIINSNVNDDEEEKKSRIEDGSSEGGKKRENEYIGGWKVVVVEESVCRWWWKGVKARGEGDEGGKGREKKKKVGHHSRG